ncbi:MAG: peptide deformylase [Elusimicrobia bacterium RIFOXYA2_FULL_50_26]|nr:MAG: peptide deformylase [Elusimicrobia bacterium RIFOXYA2_FULL_50_26]OGS25042.1 MAG: peptide deformylase [Elusimicrobia bacterium RIFOXYB2_FULL_50_12]
MSKLAIRKYGDPVLKQKCKPVEKITPKIKELLADMLETMYAAPGVGLAANQVGVSLRMCVIDVRPEGVRQPLILINPKIVSKSGAVKEEEGCLSLPGFTAMVKRSKEVRVEAVNEKGMPVVINGKDLLSRALQHEIDHLDGKIVMDYLPLWEKMVVKKEIKRRKKEGAW